MRWWSLIGEAKQKPGSAWPACNLSLDQGRLDPKRWPLQRHQGIFWGVYLSECVSEWIKYRWQHFLYPSLSLSSSAIPITWCYLYICSSKLKLEILQSTFIMFFCLVLKLWKMCCLSQAEATLVSGDGDGCKFFIYKIWICQPCWGRRTHPITANLLVVTCWHWVLNYILPEIVILWKIGSILQMIFIPSRFCIPQTIVI